MCTNLCLDGLLMAGFIKHKLIDDDDPLIVQLGQLSVVISDW